MLYLPFGAVAGYLSVALAYQRFCTQTSPHSRLERLFGVLYACVRYLTLLGLGDPLYAHGVHWVELLIVVIKVVVAFGALLVSVLLAVWWERKLISFMQSRVGPQEAGPFGLLQSLADGIKAFFKELPAHA